MVTRKINFKLFVILPVIPLFAGYLVASEHPTSEHPVGAVNAQSAKVAPRISMVQLADAIEGYIQKSAKLHGGYFLYYDKVQTKPLVLTLVRVHKKRLATLGNGVYFACTDFKTPAGKVYDLDFYMKDVGGKLEVTEISVHKVAGNARYTWSDKGGKWFKKPVKR